MKSSSVRSLRLAFVALLAIGLASSQGCSTNKLKRKFNKIELDMTEAHVDEIVAGHPMENCRNELNPKFWKHLGPPDRPCKRTPAYVKIYNENDEVEGDYSIWVYFDEDDLVVHKEFKGIMK